MRLLGLLPRRLRNALIVSQLKRDEREIESLVFKVATTVDEHEQAARLVHQSYMHRGIIEAQRSGVWVTAHGLLPWTIVFVAKLGETVVGTISLILDSQVGLPMDKVYAKELAPLRAEGRTIAEVGALCVEKSHRGRGVVMMLNKIMSLCAVELFGVQDLVLSVHPSAACQYEAVLDAASLGGVRAYPGLKKAALAVPLRIALDTLPERLAALFWKMGTDPRSPYVFYCVTREPQLEVPTMETLRERLAAVRALSAERLGALRPECFESLSTPQRRLLRPVFPTFRVQLASVFESTD